MLIECRRRIAVFMVIELCLSNADLRKAELSRCLGIDIDKYQTWGTHGKGIKVAANLRILRKVKPGSSPF